MDGLTRFDGGLMPPEAPLAHPVQDLRRAPGVSAPEGPRVQGARLWRLAIFVPAAVLTILLIAKFASGLAPGGTTWTEVALLALLGVTFFWIALAATTAAGGLTRLLLRPPPPDGPGPRTDVALLVPIHEEAPWEVFGNVAAMAADLSPAHDWTIYVLSDTRTEAVAAQELRAAAALNARLPEGRQVHYRRRARNDAAKTGNIADWITRWGGAHEAFVVLDADSLMTGAALAALADAMALDPNAGLIQSLPRLIGGTTLFARLQQFASAVYGVPLAEGLAGWSDRAGNYWGHNAILRTRAFAETAGLPRMPSFRGEGGLIMSHDFVEAGLLRRAGWGVRFEPAVPGSYEAPPATLVDFSIRDRRWCHGNLQHLALLTTKGLHPVSRFHLLSGALAYLMSPFWLALLIIWAVVGNGGNSVILYFSSENPVYPVWPEMGGAGGPGTLLFMYGMLLAPKVMGAAALPLTRTPLARLGGPLRFARSMAAEIVASIIVAPITMVQQALAVGRVVLGLSGGWKPATRGGTRLDWAALLRFHAVETVLGTALTSGMLVGMVSVWLAPIALSLLLAAPISRASGIDMSRGRRHAHFGTPETVDEPAILRDARARRDELHQLLQGLAPEGAA